MHFQIFASSFAIFCLHADVSDPFQAIVCPILSTFRGVLCMTRRIRHEIQRFCNAQRDPSRIQSSGERLVRPKTPKNQPAGLFRPTYRIRHFASVCMTRCVRMPSDILQARVTRPSCIPSSIRHDLLTLK